MFDIEDRTAMIERVFEDEDRIEVRSFTGLTVDFCKEQNAKYILRGLRDGKDFFYENSIAVMNNSLSPGLETVFLLTAAEYAGISSTILREILRNNGDISSFVPEGMMIA